MRNKKVFLMAVVLSSVCATAANAQYQTTMREQHLTPKLIKQGNEMCAKQGGYLLTGGTIKLSKGAKAGFVCGLYHSYQPKNLKKNKNDIQHPLFFTLSPPHGLFKYNLNFTAIAGANYSSDIFGLAFGSFSIPAIDCTYSFSNFQAPTGSMYWETVCTASAVGVLRSNAHLTIGQHYVRGNSSIQVVN